LRTDGELVMEFPDIVKCSKVIVKNDAEDLDQYIEGVRGIYAFDMDQIKKKAHFTPYAFGWSAPHLKNVLLETGFTTVRSEDPLTHGARIWRDTRIIATK
jgi:hypothetical protein